jgi:uncharacterized protein HemY
LQQAIGLDLGYVQAYNELGALYIRRQEWRAARAALEEGLTLDSSFAPLQKNLGRVALAENKPREAIDALRAALLLYAGRPIDSSTPLTYGPGLLAALSDQDEKWEVVYWLAKAYAANGESQEACQALAFYSQLDPNGIGEWASDASALADQLHCDQPEG